MKAALAPAWRARRSRPAAAGASCSVAWCSLSFSFSASRGLGSVRGWSTLDGPSAAGADRVSGWCGGRRDCRGSPDARRAVRQVQVQRQCSAPCRARSSAAPHSRPRRAATCIPITVSRTGKCKICTGDASGRLGLVGCRPGARRLGAAAAATHLPLGRPLPLPPTRHWPVTHKVIVPAFCLRAHHLLLVLSARALHGAGLDGAEQAAAHQHRRHLRPSAGLVRRLGAGRARAAQALGAAQLQLEPCWSRAPAPAAAPSWSRPRRWSRLDCGPARGRAAAARTEPAGGRCPRHWSAPGKTWPTSAGAQHHPTCSTRNSAHRQITALRPEYRDTSGGRRIYI